MFKASVVALNLLHCNKTIIEACQKHANLNQTEMEKISECSSTMNKFKNVSDICEVSVMNLECFRLS